MKINKVQKKSNDIKYESYIKDNSKITEDNWKKLDEGLNQIESEWRKRMMIEKYSKEFTKQSSKKLNDIDDFTVQELSCWFRLLNIKIGDKYGDIYFKHKNNLEYCEINIIYWVWMFNNKQYLLLDISFEIKNNCNKQQYGGIFLGDNIVLINKTKSLYSTNNTLIELEKRIPSFEELRK